MVDTWVLQSQVWVNATYGVLPGFKLAPVTGNTGWSTMFALTRALQHELGIPTLSDTFGPTTLAKLTQLVGDFSASSPTSNNNIIKILQCALWCKGYSGESLSGAFSPTLTASIITLRANAGLSAVGTVTPKLFKSLLTMDAYVLLPPGNALVRSIQQWMNSLYLGRANYFLIPCDGIFSRDVQRGLMYAIQYEIGLTDAVANGNLGPGTQQGIRDHGGVSIGSVDSTRRFVRLFTAALIFNKYPTAFASTFSADTKTVTEGFQQFAALPVTGVADYSTWASLLVSTGDTSRIGKAADCITTITTANAATLRGVGCEIVGRYLTNEPGPGTLNKNIKPGELDTIFASGLKVFPIYQSGGSVAGYFSYQLGLQAASAAHAAARAYGFKPGTTIYFAVDFDAIESEVRSIVVPHFRGIAKGFEYISSDYKVGIYGARNTCAIVSDEGLAVTSFVSGMSTGYSGNLGYPLPSNWAFDQILEYTVGTGAGRIGIDKDIVSGRDLGVAAVDAPIRFVDYILWLESKAASYAAPLGISAASNRRVLGFLRGDAYNDFHWDQGAGDVDEVFNEWVKTFDRPRVTGLVSPGNSRYINANHFAASLAGLVHHDWPSTTRTGVGDMCGWAGDIVQSFGQFIIAKASNMSLDSYTFGMEWIGKKMGYDASDFDEDSDALNVWNMAKADMNASIPALVVEYYAEPSGACTKRHYSFLQGRFDGSWDNALAAAKDAFYSVDPLVMAFRTGIWLLDGAVVLGTDAVYFDAYAKAWVDVLAQKIVLEG